MKGVDGKIASSVGGPGFCVGLVSLLYGEALGNQVTTVEPVVSWAFKAEVFPNILDLWFYGVAEGHKKLLRSVPLLQTLLPGALAYLVEALWKCTSKKGGTLIRKGDPVQFPVLIVEGEVEALQSDDASSLIRTYATGGYFNEISFLE